MGKAHLMLVGRAACGTRKSGADVYGRAVELEVALEAFLVEPAERRCKRCEPMAERMLEARERRAAREASTVVRNAWCTCSPEWPPVRYERADGAHGWACPDCWGIQQTG